MISIPNQSSLENSYLLSALSQNIRTVSAPFEPRGSIFQNGFLSGVLLIFDLPGVVIETGVYCSLFTFKSLCCFVLKY